MGRIMDRKKAEFCWYQNGKVEYGAFAEWKKRFRIIHGFSTRNGGVSEGCYRSMNLGFASGDDESLVWKNFGLFSEALGIKCRDLVLSDQNHQTEIRVVSEQDRGGGIIVPKKFEGIDGLITNVPGIPLVTFHADCTPLFFVDPVKGAIGMAHAGWRGALAGMASKMIRRMHEVYGSEATHIQAGFGPAIGDCCFLIREDVYDQVKMLPEYETKLKQVNDQQWSLSLESVHEHFLQIEGVPAKNIWKSGICTCCESDRLFSHRKMGDKRGNLAAVIQLY